MIDVKELLINETITLREALARLDKTAQGVLFLINTQGELIRTVTDGDLRRLIIHGDNLKMDLTHLPHKEPKFLTEMSTEQDAFKLMQEYELDHIPVLDDQNKPIRLIHRRELPQSILLSTPHMGSYEQQYVAEAFATNWIAPLGPNVDAFESEIAEYLNVPAAAALSSGTAAIHLGLVLLNVNPGDTVFCSSFTFIASANPILYQGATPVFIDSEPDSWNMSPDALARAFKEASARGKLPKAVIVVNLYGQSADMDPIRALCGSYQVPIIEDAAESLGATYKKKASGTLGDIGIYSFNGNKIITTSGGGMLVAQDTKLVEKARFLSTQARDPAPHYQHSSIGYNYRMSNVLAGIGRGQLKVLDERIKARQDIYAAYVKAFLNYDEIIMMPEASYGRSTHWLSALVLDPKKIRLTPKQFIDYLSQRNIEARHVWKPMHRQPLFAGTQYYSHAPNYSVSDDLFEHAICLPSGSNMTPQSLSRVISVIQEVLEKELV